MNELLIDAIKETLGKDEYLQGTMNDAAEHGADGGVSGFIYYNETNDFYDHNRELIIELAKDQSNDFGVGMLEMIAGFNCFHGDYTIDEIGEVLFSESNDNQCPVKNALAWYALEEVSRYCVDNDQFEEDERTIED